MRADPENARFALSPSPQLKTKPILVVSKLKERKRREMY